MRLLIAQPLSIGHYLVSYTRFVAEEALRRGWEVDLLTTAASARTDAYQLLMDVTDGRIRVWRMPPLELPPPSTLALLLHQLQAARALKSGFRAYRRERAADLVFVPDLDRCAKAVALTGSPFGSTPFSGMLIAAKHYLRQAGVSATGSRNDALWARLFDRLLRVPALRHVFTTDELLCEHVSDERPRGYGKVRYVPDTGGLDPAPRIEARARLGLEPHQCAVLLYGSLERRKGLAELLAASASADADPRLVAVVAGKETDDSVNALSSRAAQQLRCEGRLVVRSGFLDRAAEADLFAAADVVWLGYVDFDLGSGVMIQAGMAGKPILACRRGLIGHRATRHALGPVVDPTDTVDVAAALNRLAGDRETYMMHARNSAAHARAHTPMRFGATIMDDIEEALSIGGEQPHELASRHTGVEE